MDAVLPQDTGAIQRGEACPVAWEQVFRSVDVVHKSNSRRRLLAPEDAALDAYRDYVAGAFYLLVGRATRYLAADRARSKDNPIALMQKATKCRSAVMEMKKVLGRCIHVRQADREWAAAIYVACRKRIRKLGWTVHHMNELGYFLRETEAQNVPMAHITRQ